MKFGIVLFPSKSIQDLANSYRKRYDPHYALITPHLTLRAAFEATEEQIGDIAQALRQIAKQTAKFPLHITKYHSFSPVNNVIYLRVEANEQIVSLHDALHSGALAATTDYAFVPHITIGQKLSNDEHSDVLGKLKMERIDHTETIDRFHLVYQLENGAWNVHETFLLGE